MSLFLPFVNAKIVKIDMLVLGRSPGAVATTKKGTKMEGINLQIFNGSELKTGRFQDKIAVQPRFDGAIGRTEIIYGHLSGQVCH